MKKINWLISGALVLLAGAFIFIKVIYAEKKVQQQNRETEEAKEEKETEQKRREEPIVGEVLVEPLSTETEENFPEDVLPGGNMAQEEKDETVLVFGGDVYISRHVQANYDEGGIQGVISQGLLEEMQMADLCMVNEEFPFGTVGTPMEDKQYTFRVNPFYVSVFTDMGVDVVSLANNHVLDYGTDCLTETFETLKNSEIDYVGAGDTKEEASGLKSYEFQGETFGILSASRVIPVTDWNIENRQPGVFTTYEATTLVEAIRAAKEDCDYLVVYVHWGAEHTTSLEDYQIELAHSYVDAGADLVLGSHPHTLQGIESYNGKLIFYSLGNYIFNQNISKTMLVRVQSKNGKQLVSLVPAYAAGAKTTEYENREEFFSYLESLSVGISIEDGVVVLQ